MHNITSPRTDDSAIEQEIRAKGLTAPRVTPADIEAAIVARYYFTAMEGNNGSREDLRVGDEVPLSLLTFCVLVLRNGFTVTGESACVSPETFDADIGRRIAFDNAKQKLWPLLGFALKERLTQPAQPPVDNAFVAPGCEQFDTGRPPHQQRVIVEHAELSGRLAKLEMFVLGSKVFASLDLEEQGRLRVQCGAMSRYLNVLADRIAAFA